MLQLLAVRSIHSIHTGNGFRLNLKTVELKVLNILLVSDLSKTISENYDVLAGSYDYSEDGDAIIFNGTPMAYRGLFLIDKKGIVRHQR